MANPFLRETKSQYSRHEFLQALRMLCKEGGPRFCRLEIPIHLFASYHSHQEISFAKVQFERQGVKWLGRFYLILKLSRGCGLRDPVLLGRSFKKLFIWFLKFLKLSETKIYGYLIGR